MSQINQNNWDNESGGDLGYGQLLSVLWNRRYWFAGVFGSVLAISIPFCLAKKPIYLSQMQLLPESNYQTKKLSNFNSQFSESQFIDNSVEIDYATQIKVLKSSKILKRVIDKLGWQASATEEAALIEALRASLSVAQIADVDADKKAIQTKIIQTVYSDASPTQSKRVLEAVQEVYLEYNLEQQEKRLKDGLTFIDQQIPKAEKSLNKADAAVTNLSKKYSVVDPQQEAISIKQSIRDIAVERSSLKAQRSELMGNYRALQKQLGLSPETSINLSRLSQSPRYQNLLDELQNIEIELASSRSRHKDNSPVVQDLVEQKKNQKELLKVESRKVFGRVPANFDRFLESLGEQGQLVSSDTQFVNDITEAQATLEGIAEREITLAATEENLRSKLTDFPELISRYTDLTQEAQVRREALQKLREAKQELEIELNRGVFNWQVIEPPQLGQQKGPNLKKDLLLSLVIASFLGSSAAFIREALDQRISSLKEAESQTDLPFLGSTPSLSLSSSDHFVAKVPFLPRATVEPKISEVIQWQPFREAMDVVYENLKLSGLTSSLHSIAITSAVAGEGKSTLALGLALSVARHQQRVLIIDADLRRPSLHKDFNIPNLSGLTDYLTKRTDQPDIERVFIQGEPIDLITSGPQTDDPVKLLNSPRFQGLIEKYREDYDLILIDTPPTIGTVDAIKISSICDSVLLAMRLNQVKSHEFSESVALLSRSNVLGVVANDSQEYEIKNTYLLPQQA